MSSSQVHSPRACRGSDQGGRLARDNASVWRRGLSVPTPVSSARASSFASGDFLVAPFPAVADPATCFDVGCRACRGSFRSGFFLVETALAPVAAFPSERDSLALG